MPAERSSFRNRPFSTMFSLRSLLLLLPLLIVAGCGDVEWLPEYEREPTTPDKFSFESKKGVALSAAVTSDPVTITGITAGSAPISITGRDESGSKYSIDGQTPTSASGTVSNGQKITITHTASKDLGRTTTSTLTIGNVRETFSSTTQTVTLEWLEPTDVGSYRQAIAEVTANDNVSGGHVISVKDSLNSSNPQFAVNVSGDLFFRKDEATFARLDNQRIYVQNLRSSNATTTLTIDGTDFTVPLR